uniref:DUF6033 family protein n=1 Tax=Agathobacter sp. TaxID=2021311 RepID=UPI0040568E28
MNQIFGMDRFVKSIVNKSESVGTSKKTEHAKNTIGNPKLSEAASSYYENLKAKYGDVEFVLVDDEQSGTAKEQLANHQGSKSLTVFISESEVEEMAVNETTRTQNEGLIDNAIAKMPDMMEQLKESGANIKSFGMEISDDGSVSYFAVVDRSMQAQKERIEQNRTQKKEAEKAETKKTAKENLTTITASTLDDLYVKVQDAVYAAKSDLVRTRQEMMVGQNFDFKL